MKKKFSLITIVFCLFSLNGFTQDVISEKLEFGSYSVGYKVIHTYDYSRSYFPKYDYYGNRTDRSIGRPMQISIWYPAEINSKSHPVTYKDYIGFRSSEVDFSKNSIQDRSEFIDDFYHGFDSSQHQAIEKLLNETANSFLFTEEFGKDYPIILYAPPMNTSATDNSIICEYLSSKGYIVLSVMAKGEYSLLQSRTLRDIYTQAEDLAFLLDFAKGQYSSDKVGVFGFSLGGLSNIIFASKNRNIDATVSLDGSIMSQGWLELVESSEYFAPGDFTSNLLLIGKNLQTPELNPSTFYDNVKYADKALIRYDHSEHGIFSGINLLYQITTEDDLSSVDKKSYAGFYTEMTRYIGDFFDHHLKNSDSFKEYTTKKFNHEFTSEAGLRKPVEPKILGQLIINHGYDYVQNILSDILEYDENYLAGLDWRELHATSQALQDKGRINDAIHTLLLSNKAFPGWYITNYELGRLYLKIGELDKSIISFKQALMDNPRHKESLAALKQLGITTPDYHDQKIDNLGKYFGVYVVDDERFREIYLENGELYLASNYWDKPVKLWPYTHDLFLVESDDPINNIQVLFNFDEVGEVNSLSIRGLNSGRINAPNFKKKE